MADDFLRHVCQRIDALTYDDHSQYLLGSLRAADMPTTPGVSSGPSLTSAAGVPTPRIGGARPGSFGGPTAAGGAMAVTVSSRRRRAHPRWAKTVGLTSYYVRFVLLIGVGWFFAMMGVFAFLYSFSELSEHDVHLSVHEQIMALTMQFAGGAVGCILFGSLADHYGRRRVLLLAVGEWIVANALTGASWGPASLLVLRALASLGIGGEFVMLVTISLEYTPKRTRGRITVLSLTLATIGIITGVWYGHVCVPRFTWRASFGVVSGVAVLYLGVLYAALEESPKYLASTGRSAEALRVLAVMETAHGIDRQARVTVPTSLYAPRPQQPQLQHSESISEQYQAGGERRRALTELYRHPHHVDFQDQVDDNGAVKQQRRWQDESDDNELRGALGIGVDPRQRAMTDHGVVSGAADPSVAVGGMSPGVVSFAQSLRLRLTGVLLRSPLLGRTLLLWLLWFSTCLSVSTAISSIIVLAAISHDGSFTDQLVWSGATIPGILLAAVLVERAGRKVTLAVFLFADGVAMAAIAALLSSTSSWGKFVWSTAFLALSVTGSIGAICAFTGEQYPLMVRSLGMGLSAGAGHLGIFTGVYTILRLIYDCGWRWAELRIAVAASSGIVLLVALPLAALTGVETRGHDVDTLEWHALNARKWPRKRDQRHQRDFEGGGEDGGSGSSSRNQLAIIGGAVRGLHETRTSSIENSAMLAAPTRTTRAVSTSAVSASTRRAGRPAAAHGSHRSSLPVLMASPSSSASSAGGLASLMSPQSAAMSLSPSSLSSSSSSSGFWKKRSVHRLRRQVKAVADAVRARRTPSISNLSTSGATKKARAFTGSSRSTTLPGDDLDLLDTIVTDHELDADGGYAFESGHRRRTKSEYQRRRTRTASSGTYEAHSRWFVPTLSNESVMSIGRWRQSSSASSSSASSSSSVEPLEPPVPRAKRKSSRADRLRARSRHQTDPEPVLEILEPSAFMGSGRFPVAEEKEDKPYRARRADGGHKSSGEESHRSIDLDMFDSFTSISTPVTAGGGAR